MSVDALGIAASVLPVGIYNSFIDILLKLSSNLSTFRSCTDTSDGLLSKLYNLLSEVGPYNISLGDLGVLKKLELVKQNRQAGRQTDGPFH